MKKMNKKICSVICLGALIFGFTVPTFAATPSVNDSAANSDYATKDLITGEVSYTSNSKLAFMNTSLADVQPAFEGTAEQAPVISPRNIIGSDGRWQVSNGMMTTFPYRAIGYIISTFPDGKKFLGTGWFFKSNAIVTAGHLAYRKSNGGWATKVEVYPGKNGISNPYGGATSTTISAPTPWTQSEDITMDYALVKLNSALGNNVGWFGYSYNRVPYLNQITVAGYPGDKPQTMWAMTGKISSQSEYLLTYTIDTERGQSGSPIFDSDKISIGVHRGGTSTYNQGKKIHKDMYNWMVSY